MVQDQRRVVVPDVVGMTVLAGRRAAVQADVVLAQVDADGPPLGAELWPHESQYVITSQSPAPGTAVRRFESVVVTYERTADGAQGIPVRGPGQPPPRYSGQQVPLPPLEGG